MASPALPNFSRSRRTWVSTARVHPTTTLQERAQKFELDAGQMDTFSADRNLMAHRIDRDGTGCDGLFIGFAAAAAQNRFDTQDDFTRAERLRHVIVCTKFQSDDSI